MRAALYIDGFNFYHAVDNLNQPFLKWLNLWALGNRIIDTKTESLVRVVWCTAKKPHSPEKNQRHQEYITALKLEGVEVLEGHFIEDSIECNDCHRVWSAPKEKESDINLALSVIDDAYQDLVDHFYLLTSDSDQGATARFFAKRFPKKKLTSVVPPGMEASKAIRTHTPHKIKIHESYLEQCLLPPLRTDEIEGKKTLRYRRPPKYNPPPGWVPPDKRP